MAIGIGMGTSVFPFDEARDYFKWVDKCEAGKVDSIWQTDRLVSKESMLECLSAMAILAGYTDKMAKFFESNPGFRSRIAHHIDFPDYSTDELVTIAETMLDSQNYYMTNECRIALKECADLRREQPHFANARSIRNALERINLQLDDMSNRVNKTSNDVLSMCLSVFFGTSKML